MEEKLLTTLNDSSLTTLDAGPTPANSLPTEIGHGTEVSPSLPVETTEFLYRVRTSYFPHVRNHFPTIQAEVGKRSLARRCTHAQRIRKAATHHRGRFRS
ncbi:MAG: hypothetical protein JWN34_1331 [Bryobacterales bacterium]|nr:hypothetical protein [Bryobacterales bacterium]